MNEIMRLLNVDPLILQALRENGPYRQRSAQSAESLQRSQRMKNLMLRSRIKRHSSDGYSVYFLRSYEEKNTKLNGMQAF